MVNINDTLRYGKDRIFKNSTMVVNSNDFAGVVERDLKVAEVVELYYTSICKTKFSI